MKQRPGLPGRTDERKTGINSRHRSSQPVIISVFLPQLVRQVAADQRAYDFAQVQGHPQQRQRMTGVIPGCPARRQEECVCRIRQRKKCDDDEESFEIAVKSTQREGSTVKPLQGS